MKNLPHIAFCFLFAAFSTYAQVNLPNGLMAHYPFTGNADDASGNGNTGTPNGPTLRPDRANTPNAGYEFDGVDDNIVVANSATFDIVNDKQSISFWFQLCFIPQLGDNHEYYMLSKMDGTTSHGWHIFMRRDPDALRIYYRGVDNGNFATQNVVTCPISNIEIGSWHHVVFIMGNGSSGTRQSAIFDNVYTDYLNKNSLVAQSTVPLVIGGGLNVWNPATDAYFGLGRLDDIRYYNRAITNDEVAALYNLIPTNTFNQTPTITNNDGLCLSNDSLIITASSIPGLTYTWTGPNSETFTGNQIVIENPTATNDGTYTLTTDFDGCPRPTLTVDITPPLPQAMLTGPTQVCTNTPFSFSVTDTPNATYTWQYPGAGTPSGNTLSWNDATAAESGDYHLSYTVNGCIGYSDTITMAVVQQYSITAYDTICQGQSVLLGGAQQTSTGTYQDLYQSVTGCDSLVTTELFVKPLPQVSLGADQQSCVGSTVTLNAVTNGNIVGWNTSETSASIDVTATGSYWIESELDGCTARDTVEVSFFLNPAADFTANDPDQCLMGNTFDFTPGNTFAPGTIFNWTFTGAAIPTSTANTPTGISWDSDGTYSVTLVVTENGCVSAPASLNITVFPQPVANFTALPTQGCEPVDVKFENTTQSAVLYTSAWTMGDGNSSNDQSPAYTYVQDGTYHVTLTVTDNNGCTDTESKPNFITVFPQPVAGFSLAEDVLSTTAPVLTVINESVQSTTCLYYLNDGTVWNDCSFSANVMGSGVYTITQVVTSGSGCVDSTSRVFTVRPTPEIFIPNTFTPNGDFVNERFEPSLSWIGNYNLTIFDRWGAVVFETDDLFTYWNGKFFNYGKDLPQGVYAYKIRYKPYEMDKDIYLTGSVSLIR